MNTPLQRHKGFTLIEVMIVIAILGVLVSLAMPGFQGWLRSAKLRSFAESFQTGIQIARAEAINRNAYVEMVLTNSAVGSDSNRNANTVDESTSGNAWLVRECTTCANINTAATADSTYPYIEGKVLAEGGSAKPPAVNANVSLIRFDGLGRANTALTLVVADTAEKAKAADCTPAPKGDNDDRIVKDPVTVCVVMDRGGNARMCLPDVRDTHPSSCVRS